MGIPYSQRRRGVGRGGGHQSAHPFPVSTACDCLPQAVFIPRQSVYHGPMLVGRPLFTLLVVVAAVVAGSADLASAQGPLRRLMPGSRPAAEPNLAAAADANADAHDPNAADPNDPNSPGDPNSVGGAVDNLGDFVHEVLGNFELLSLWKSNSVYQWLVLLGAIFLGIVVGRLVKFALNGGGGFLEKRNWPARAHLLSDLAAPAALLCVTIGLGVGVFQLDLTDPVRTFSNRILILLLVVSAFWYLYNLVAVVEVVAYRLTRRTRSDLDDMVVPLFRKALRLFVLVIGVLFIAQNVLGANIASWLAGLGIVGLAVSLAAQDSLKHIFGSITIFFDRPFLVGSFIKFKDELGTVQEIGFRSTRMRTLDGHLMTIPNGNIINDAVINVGARPFIRRVMNVTITYDTPAEKVEQALQIIKDILKSDGIRENVYDADDPDNPANFPPRVSFSDFNAASLNIVVYYWHRPPDWWEYLAHCQKFNLELFRRYNEAGIDFAFPTQTLHLAGDANRDPIRVAMDRDNNV